MRARFSYLPVVILALVFSAFGQNDYLETTSSPVPVAGYDVTFTLASSTTAITTRKLTIISFVDHTATFRLINPRTTWQPPSPFPAVWAAVTPTFLSFSGEIEFPIGNCCRETGTLILKGDRSNTGVITGSAIFVTNIQSTANPGQYAIKTGMFVATPLPIIASPDDSR